MISIFKRNLLVIVLLPIVILFIGSSYLRFIVLNDYLVTYKSDCDPQTHSCFTECGDSECSEPYYYKKMQKYAPNLEAQCGPDITDCSSASECLEVGDERCEVTYCEMEVGTELCKKNKVEETAEI